VEPTFPAPAEAWPWSGGSSRRMAAASETAKLICGYVLKEVVMTEQTFRQRIDPDMARRLREMEEREQQSNYRNALLNNALNQSSDAVFLIDHTLRFVFVNEAACRSLGYSRDDLLTMTSPDIDPDVTPEMAAAMMAELFATGRQEIFQTRHRSRDGRIFPVEISVSMFEHLGEKFSLCHARDITGRRRMEEERLAYLRHLETMDRVNRIIQETGDLEQMMSDVLDAMLAVFDCDRAFLLYPCDPEAPSWQVPMERTRPEYPGALAQGLELTMDPDTANMFRTTLAVDGPVRFGPGFEPLPRDVSEQFTIKSFIAVALFPKMGKPWQFGLHQCSHPRVWTAEEMTLFQAAGRRLSDALTSLMAYQQLRESEEKYRLVVDNSTDSLFLLEVTGDGRFRNLLVNRAFEESVGMTGRQLVGRFQEETVPEETARTVMAKYRRCVETGAVTTEEAELDLPAGRLVFRSTLIPVRDANGKIHRLVGVTRNITERKRMERVVQARLKMLEIAQTADVSLDGTLRGMLDEIEALTGSSIGFYHFLEEDQQTLFLQTGSTNTLAAMGSVEIKENHYPVANAGIWADCVRERRPVIHNDYASLPNRRGMPAGHALVVRELVVPIFRDNRIVAIIGVGNKPQEYTDTDVQIVSLLGDFSWEIVTRKQAEERLRRRESEFRALAENSPDNIIRYDTGCRAIYINPRMERTLGRPAAPILGKTPLEDAGEEFHAYQERIEQVIATGEDAEFDVFMPDTGEGERHHNIRFVAERGANGEIIGVLAIGRDITERKRMEEALALREREFRALVEHSPDVLVRYDRDCRRLYVNPTFCELSGIPATEALGLTPSSYSSLPGAGEFEERIRGVFSSGEVDDYEYTWPIIGDALRIYHVRLVPERDENGRIASAFSVGRDITERKLMEDELHKKNAELERFSYTVSHDLKSPLVTIKSFSGSIGNDLASGRNDRIEKDLGRISGAADKMAALLDDLLKLSRVGRVINTPEPVDMARLVDDVLKNLAGTLKEHSIQVFVQPGLPTVPCDRQRMMEVVQNLVENAVKYREDQPAPRIEIGVEGEGGRQVFFVRDNGPGIDPKYHESIFGLFNRLSTRIPGTGIGLALARRIIETHDGSIWVESDGQGNGSTFYFTVKTV
jgi:PAS domain S-box-containing protein